VDERATRKSSVTPASGGRCGSYSWLLAPVVKAAKVPSIDGMTSAVAPLDKVQRSTALVMRLTRVWQRGRPHSAVGTGQ
jgi:hypothetical protein